jgi:predicted ferric reductase
MTQTSRPFAADRRQPQEYRQTQRYAAERPTQEYPLQRRDGPVPQRSTTLGPTGRLPTPRGAGQVMRRMLSVAFWAGLIASLAVWWQGTPVGSVHTFGTALVEAGRITGMVAGYILLVQILLMSRVAWLDRRLSANSLLTLHRDFGFALLVLVLMHAGLLIFGYAQLDQVGPWAETKTMLSGFIDMISTFVATGLLIAVGIMAMRFIRSRLPYEIWYRLHLSTYVVLLLGYGHQFADGRDLSQPGLAHTYWLSLYYFVLFSLFWGRIVTPLALNLQHRLRVAEVIDEGSNMFSIYVTGRHLDKLGARAGQFFRWRFLSSGVWSQAHPFSLSAAPNVEWLRLTVKAVGNHTEQLKWLDPGVRVWAQGPSGVFTADHRTRHRALLIAGGSGIAPIRALLEDLPRGTIVIYRASSPEDIVFREELNWLAEERNSLIYYVIGARTDPGPSRAMTTRGLRHIVPDISRRDVYLCGPEGLVTSSVQLLRRLHVPRKQIHLDPFEF